MSQAIQDYTVSSADSGRVVPILGDLYQAGARSRHTTEVLAEFYATADFCFEQETRLRFASAKLTNVLWGDYLHEVFPRMVKVALCLERQGNRSEAERFFVGVIQDAQDWLDPYLQPPRNLAVPSPQAVITFTALQQACEGFLRFETEADPGLLEMVRSQRDLCAFLIQRTKNPPHKLSQLKPRSPDAGQGFGTQKGKRKRRRP